MLLKGTPQIVACPARSAVGMRVPAAWKPAIEVGRLTIRSAIDEGFEVNRDLREPKPTARRPTATLAEHRNRFVASISDGVLILHASPGGKLDRLAGELSAASEPLWTLEDPANQHLIERGARPVTPATIESIWAEA